MLAQPRLYLQTLPWLALKSVTAFVLNALTCCVLNNFNLYIEFYICVLPSDWTGNVQMNSEETGVIKKHLVSVGCVRSLNGQHRGKDYFCESQISLLLSYSLYFLKIALESHLE